MALVQLQPNFITYRTDDEIVIYSQKDKKTFLFSLEQAFALGILLDTIKIESTMTLAQWFSLCNQVIKDDKAYFDEITEQYLALGIIKIT